MKHENEVQLDAMMRVGVWVAVVYAGLQLISNIASLKIGVVGGFSVDMGTFCYPLTFTIRDMAHKVLGKKRVTELVWLSAALCLAASVYFGFCAVIPSAVEGSGFDAVFSPMWRLVMASIGAMVVSELVDTQVFHLCAQRWPRREWRRVILSNAVSMPLDNFIFALGAFGWVLPWGDV